VIGRAGGLPWRLPDDMKRVRALTIGKPLIMGRRTYDSIGHALPQRTNIVLTRDPSFHADGVLVARTPDEALRLAGDAPEVIVFGGAEIFRLFLPQADRIYLTQVDAEVEGDTVFDFDATDWTVLENERHEADERHPYAFTFLTLERMRRAGFVWDERVASHVYREDHPLKPRRLVGVYQTLETLGAFGPGPGRLLAPRAATRDEIERIHAPEYVEAVMQASADPDMDYGEWGLDAYGDTPPFAGMHEVSLLTTGGSLVAMEHVLSGHTRVSVNYSGGLHHAMRRRASGFCIYNDPAIVCATLAERGMRVAYVDIDAHHGDGVQAAFYETDQVLTISLHETGAALFPGTGFARERGRGRGAGYSINVALPPFTDDPAYVRAFDAVVPELLARYRPDVLVTQQGIDPHFLDPLTHLRVSTHAREHVVREFAATPYPWVAMGGGGYALDAVRRTWAMEYLVMIGSPVPDELHDADPPISSGAERATIDEMTDDAVRDALAAAW